MTALSQAINSILSENNYFYLVRLKAYDDLDKCAYTFIEVV